MKLGLQLGYWGAQPPANVPELIAAAEAEGFDAVFAAESWGSDAFTPSRGGVEHRTCPPRHLGRADLGAYPDELRDARAHPRPPQRWSGDPRARGVGPAGGRGWYGQPFEKPLARTREYVSIVRQVLDRREPVTNAGPHYPLPYTGPGSTGLGKPLKPITHPSGQTSRSGSAPRVRRTRRSPPKSPTAGSRSTTHPASPPCTTHGSTRVSRGRVPVVAGKTSKWRPPVRSSSPTTAPQPSTG